MAIKLPVGSISITAEDIFANNFSARSGKYVLPDRLGLCLPGALAHGAGSKDGSMPLRPNALVISQL
ncbi:MAG: hypothetical protein NTX52_12230 [Planctomycetota bacterium]|nr:hypothetical protein [Planctomycetota bacterium]